MEPRPRKTRVVQTPEERALIVRAAIEVRAERPGLSLRATWAEASRRALPEHRRQQTGVSPANGLGWLEAGLREAAGPPTPRDRAHAVVESIFDQGPTIADLAARMASLEAKLDRLAGAIHAMHEAFGELVGSPGPAPDPGPEPAQPAPTPPRKPRARIGLVGPKGDQVGAIRHRINGDVNITVIENEKSAGQVASRFAGCDWVVITRHARHHHYDDAIRAVGRERVVRLRTGGVGETAARINELIGRA